MASTWFLGRVAARRGFRSDPSAPYIYLGKRECWKCHEQTTVAAFGIPYRVAEDSGGQGCAQRCAHHERRGSHRDDRHRPRQRHCHRPRAGLRAAEIRDYLRERCGYKPVTSRTTKTVSLASTCTGCALQGSYYLFEEPTSPFALTAINKLPAPSSCVEVAGVYGIPASQRNITQALFTWARDHHTQKFR